MEGSERKQMEVLKERERVGEVCERSGEVDGGLGIRDHASGTVVGGTGVISIILLP